MENYIQPTTSFDELSKEEQAKVLSASIRIAMHKLYELGTHWQKLELTEPGNTTEWTQETPPNKPRVHVKMEISK